MSEPKYSIKSEKNYPEVFWLECDDLSLEGAEWVIAYLEKQFDDSAFNLGLTIVEVIK